MTKQHEMPRLTDEQRTKLIERGNDVVKNGYALCQKDEDLIKIALACLTAEPHAWHRMPDQGFHLPMVLRKEQGPPAVDGEFYPVYDAPPVPVLKPIELPKPYGMQDFDKWLRQDEVIESIRASGGVIEGLDG